MTSKSQSLACAAALAAPSAHASDSPVDCSKYSSKFLEWDHQRSGFEEWCQVTMPNCYPEGQ